MLESRDGPVTAYVMEVEDSEPAREAYRASTLPIDLEHREVIEEVLTDAPPVEGLLDLSMPGGSGLGNRPLSRSALPSSVRYASRR